jgi:hydrogenase small subunit
MDEPTVYDRLAARGVTRREFVQMCGGLVALMGLHRLPPVAGWPAEAARRDDLARAVAQALAQKPRTPVLWLAGQDCAGCTESVLRSRDPAVLAVVLDVLALEYQETIMAAAGSAAEERRRAVMAQFPGQYVLVVEGAIPDEGGYCAIGGQAIGDMVREAAAGAAFIVATGNCASFGGLPAARPNPTGARALRDVLPGRTVINIPGCPAIPEVTAGTLAQLALLGQAPALDDLGRPLAFYGETVHDGCPRRPHFRNREFAKSFDDAGARAGWCLYELGCRGPDTYNACSQRGWGQGLSSPVRAGHPCLGCSEPGFWDQNTFYPWAPRPYDAFLPFAVRKR